MGKNLNLIEIFNRIKSHCRIKTDKDLADILGIKPATVGNLKTRFEDQGIISRDTWHSLSDFCIKNDVPADWLFFGITPQNKDTETLKYTIELLQKNLMYAEKEAERLKNENQELKGEAQKPIERFKKEG